MTTPELSPRRHHRVGPRPWHATPLPAAATAALLLAFGRLLGQRRLWNLAGLTCWFDVAHVGSRFRKQEARFIGAGIGKGLDPAV